MPAAGLPSLQLCGSAVCFFFHGLSLPISFAHIYLFFQHLASPEGIQALSGATSPNAQRLNRTVQTWGLNSTGLIVLWSLIIVEVDFCQLSLSCHNWRSAPLCQLAARPVVALVQRRGPRADVASRGPQLRHVCP